MILSYFHTVSFYIHTSQFVLIKTQRYIFPDGSGESESTSFGCDCEGWGVGADGQSLFFNEAIGSSSPLDYTILMSTATPSTYISKVVMASGRLTVTHDFHPSPSTPNLYEVTVTLENTSGATINDVYYRRNMDWDVYPTTYSECSTIQVGRESCSYLTSCFAKSSETNYSSSRFLYPFSARPSDCCLFGRCNK